jgi:hypothetical protein
MMAHINETLFTIIREIEVLRRRAVLPIAMEYIMLRQYNLMVIGRLMYHLR